MSILSLTATPSDGTITLTWKVTSTGGKGIDVLWGPHGSTAALNAVELPANAAGYTIVGLTDGQQYDFTVDYVSARATRSATPTSPTPPPPPPPAPVTLVTEPTVSGTMQAGDKLTATPGTYENAVSVTQQWLSGTPANQGVLAGQTVVGTGLTYTLGTVDVGNQITLAETATGAAGTTPLSITDYLWGTTPVIAATPPPTPPVAPIVTTAAAQVSSTTVVITASVNSVVTSASLSVDGGTPVSTVPANGEITFTLTGEAVGSHSAVITVSASGQTVTATATVPFTIATTPPPSGLIVGPFFNPADPFRRLLPAVRVVDPLSAGWVSKYIGTTGIAPGAGTNVTGSSLATGTDGWPIYEAKSTDPKITITGTSAYGTATLHCPVGVVPQAPVGGDAHLIIIEPVGVSPTHPTMVVVTEFYQAVVQNGVVVRATGVQQFNASTNAPINALTAQLLSEPGSCRGCGSSCLDGPVLESEYLAGVQGIQHALCFTAPWAQGLVNGVKQYRSPVAIIGSPGGPADGVPYGACIDIDPAYDITQVSAVLQPLAWAIQNYGAYVTDNTDLNTGLGFQAQAGSGKSAAYQSLDGGNALNGLPWAHMRVLRSWNGQ